MSFSNNPKDFFININKLSEVLVDMIYSYMPISVTMFLTKKQYLTDHYLIRNFIPKVEIEQYIRTMVIQDNNFVFKQLLFENYERWLKMTKYYYKECIYGNYLNFLESFSIDNQSINCRQEILNLIEQEGLSKNQHKKNTSKYIKWRT